MQNRDGSKSDVHTHYNGPRSLIHHHLRGNVEWNAQLLDTGNQFRNWEVADDGIVYFDASAVDGPRDVALKVGIDDLGNVASHPKIGLAQDKRDRRLALQIDYRRSLHRAAIGNPSCRGMIQLLRVRR